MTRLALLFATLVLSGCVGTGEFNTRMSAVESQLDPLRSNREEFDRRQMILDTKIKAIEDSSAPSASLEQQVRTLSVQLDRANARIAELDRAMREKTDSLTKENQALRELIRQESDDLNDAIKSLRK